MPLSAPTCRKCGHFHWSTQPCIGTSKKSTKDAPAKADKKSAPPTAAAPKRKSGGITARPPVRSGSKAATQRSTKRKDEAVAPEPELTGDTSAQSIQAPALPNKTAQQIIAEQIAASRGGRPKMTADIGSSDPEAARRQRIRDLTRARVQRHRERQAAKALAGGTQ